MERCRSKVNCLRSSACGRRIKSRPWIRTGARTYQLNHFGISYDSTGATLIGPARIQQWLTLDSNGDSTTGKFTVVQWDESGNVLAHVQGNVTGTRVTMETGFQSVE